MPATDAAETQDLGRSIERLFTSARAQRPQAVRAIFVERLDFLDRSVDLPLHREGLPPAAQRVAERDGVAVVFVQLPTTGRITGRLLSDVFLVVANDDAAEWQLVYPTSRGGREVLRRMALQRGHPYRTVVEQLAEVYWKIDRGGDLRAALDGAYDVEAVTKTFFREYDRIFKLVLGQVTGLADDDERKLFCQTLFNRLMFLYFLQRKGWLTFDGDPNYLHALWRDYQTTPETERAGNFYTGRLRPLFFTALSNARSANPEMHYADGLIGRVPFLNGGLFAQDALDQRAGAGVPDDAIETILHRLFERFNFTIMESTPYDVEVAVDPEMLGKVFEELVTGRHETGSYYTPRPVVSFMCREALKGYLAARVEGLPEAAVAPFVDEHSVAAIPVSRAGAVLDALEAVTVVDPACGSGAYLLGMLHELVDLQRLLYNSAMIAGSRELYELKLRVIERNVFGVDVDRFAVNIAMLRLWLSLIVDFEGRFEDIPALPNLDYKIARGDSLTAPNPQQTAPDLISHRARALADEISRFKGTFLRATGDEKRHIQQDVERGEAELRDLLAHSAIPAEAIDWRVQFAEVFERGGFDVVLANPPYVRQELIKDIKPALKAAYGDLYSGTADLYVYFYYRALQLLKKGGMLVFISSNKWFRANYGAKLRKHIAESCHVLSITDFGDLPLFESATAYPMIFIAQESLELDEPTVFTEPLSLAPPYPDVRDLIQQRGRVLPSTAIQGGNWLLTDAAIAGLVHRMKTTGTPLGECVEKRIYWGLKTGYNTAFVINGAKRAELIARDGKSNEIIKPFATGKDVRRWSVRPRDQWLILAPIGVDIKRYAAVFAHLKQWQPQLEKRWDKGKHWWELRACDYYPAFAQPKIVFPDIALEARFALDRTGTYLGNTTYFIPTDDLYLLGVLNSSAVKAFYLELSAQVRGGYMRFFTQYVERIPIPDAPPAERAAIEGLVRKCLDAKGQGPDVVAWEAEIDARVARLYGLSDADLAAMQGTRTDAPNEDDAATA